jgi:hypothetical protein
VPGNLYTARDRKAATLREERKREQGIVNSIYVGFSNYSLFEFEVMLPLLLRMMLV